MNTIINAFKKNGTTHLSPSYFYNIKTASENYNFPKNVNITAVDNGFKIKFKSKGSHFLYQTNMSKNNTLYTGCF